MLISKFILNLLEQKSGRNLVYVYFEVQAVKYLYKYIYKGPDRAQTILEPVAPENKTTDEIKDYVDNRYVSGIEAVWNIFSFPMHGQNPPVIRLETHLENQNTQVYKDNEKLGDVQKRNKLSKLTAWFELNKTDPEARVYLYHEIPKHYVWKSIQNKWQKRKNAGSKMIGRMYFTNPSDMERFCLRLLLLNTPGATSFENIRTFNGKIFETYQEACIERGLMADDKTWDDTLKEAALTETDTQKFRLLFAMILIFCSPSNPGKLW